MRRLARRSSPASSAHRLALALAGVPVVATFSALALFSALGVAGAVGVGCSSSTTGSAGDAGGDALDGDGASGEHPIRAADFDQSCTTSEDCVAARTGDTCAICACPNDAVAASAKPAYDDAYTSLHAQCPPRNAGYACAACAPTVTTCESGKCVLRQCANVGSDPHVCLDDDAGADGAADAATD